MIFDIEDGLDLLSIRFFEVGSYFRFKKPICVVWDDCRGSVGQYFTLLPEPEEYRSELRNRILESLNEDFSDREEELYQVLKPLFKLFKNGHYGLGYYKSEEFFKFRTWKDGAEETYMAHWTLIMEDRAQAETEKEIAKRYFGFFERQNLKKHYESLFNCTTSGFYEGFRDRYLIATRSKADINQQRVKYFEEKIKEGERPFAIVLSSLFHEKVGIRSIEQISAPDFVLDGHHKLLAYSRLNIYPPIVAISHLPQTKAELEFEVESLLQEMYPWQMEHIMHHIEDKDVFVKELNDPKSKIHKYIKNGRRVWYYDSGEKQSEVFYLNDKPHGKEQGWYKNGQVAWEKHWNRGKPVGVSIDYYQDGRLRSWSSWEDKGEYDYHLIEYDETGNKIKEEFRYQQEYPPTHPFLKTYYPNGHVKSEETCNEAMVCELKEYNIDGSIKAEKVWDVNHPWAEKNK